MNCSWSLTLEAPSTGGEGVNHQRGSPIDVVNVADAEDVLLDADYDVFGKVTSFTSSETDASGNPVWPIPFGFAGGLYDADTGLVRFGAREYDPTVGRWTSKDPILFAGGQTNLYVYVNGDPVNRIDPWGTEDFSSILNVVAFGLELGAGVAIATGAVPLGIGLAVAGGVVVVYNNWDWISGLALDVDRAKDVDRRVRERRERDAREIDRLYRGYGGASPDEMQDIINEVMAPPADVECKR